MDRDPLKIEYFVRLVLKEAEFPESWYPKGLIQGYRDGTLFTGNAVDVSRLGIIGGIKYFLNIGGFRVLVRSLFLEHLVRNEVCRRVKKHVKNPKSKWKPSAFIKRHKRDLGVVYKEAMDQGERLDNIYGLYRDVSPRILSGLVDAYDRMHGKNERTGDPELDKTLRRMELHTVHSSTLRKLLPQFAHIRVLDHLKDYMTATKMTLNQVIEEFHVPPKAQGSSTKVADCLLYISDGMDSDIEDEALIQRYNHYIRNLDRMLKFHFDARIPNLLKEHVEGNRMVKFRPRVNGKPQALRDDTLSTQAKAYYYTFAKRRISSTILPIADSINLTDPDRDGEIQYLMQVINLTRLYPVGFSDIQNTTASVRINVKRLLKEASEDIVIENYVKIDGLLKKQPGRN